MKNSGRKRDQRDARLWRLLPRKNDPYGYDKLSEAETSALVEALGDGFGNVLVPNYEPLPIPRTLKTGLLRHSFYVDHNTEYDPDDWDDAFWNSDDDALPPYEWFPLHFNKRRLKVYFQNQFVRFCAQTACERNIKVKDFGPSIFEQWAFERLYQKPWYEVHALQFLDWIENDEILKYPKFALLVNVDFGGQLGRLVEQYFWRFSFERAAITGAGTQIGASAGGKARAAIYYADRSKWQKLASEIWAQRPRLSKIAVATTIKNRLGSPRTAKHIARYIHQSSKKM